MHFPAKNARRRRFRGLPWTPRLDSMPPEFTEREPMRILLASALLLASMAAAQAQVPTGALQMFDVPAGGKAQTVYIAHRILKPGESIGLHTHDGAEITHVIAGDFQLTFDGKNTAYHAGGSFIVPRGAKHDGKNIGTTDCELAVTYVLDKGAPLREAATP
jgi:quercetin dioxygenase-like cupin family protein